MYLKQLEMNGFKSFVESRLFFQPGITAVVGPNGTGKSNILDAILWVLGEQSTKAMRSERMEDVIFNGTESRKPHGMTEVSLILGAVDNGPSPTDAAPAPLPYSLEECREVMVTRRLFRDGVSEYFINKTPCRLKDIRSLLLDSRAGSKGHTVIEQGMIDRLLKASPLERRELIEETAGIIRYKKQKAEALRKLDATTQNLLRVRDIVNEVKRQLGSLERQARAAEAYQALRQEVRRLELRVLVHDYREVAGERHENDRRLNELDMRESAEVAVVGRHAASVETMQLEVTHSETALSAVREQMAAAEARMTQAGTAIELMVQKIAFLEEQRRRVEADVEHVRTEQRDAETEVKGLRVTAEELQAAFALTSNLAAEVETALSAAQQRYRESQALLESARAAVMEHVLAGTAAVNRLASDRARAGELSRRVERLEQDRVRAGARLDAVTVALSSHTVRKQELETQLAASGTSRGDHAETAHRLKADIAECDQQIVRLQEKLTVSIARGKALHAVKQDAVILPPSVTDRFGETVTQVLTVPAEYEAAVEAVLGHRLVSALIETPSEAVSLLETLKAQGLGGGSFLPRRPRLFGGPPAVTFDGPGVLGSALSLVRARDGYEDLVQYLLAGVVIVDSLERAITVWASMNEARRAVLVTVKGEILTPEGMVSGTPIGAAVGAISRERELLSLTAQIEDLERRVERARAERGILEESFQSAALPLEALEAEVRTLEMAVLSERKDQQRAEEDVTEWRQRIETTLAERLAAEAELNALTASEQSLREELERLESQKLAAEQGLVERQNDVAANEDAFTHQQAVVAQVRLEKATLCDRLDQARRDISRHEDAIGVRHVRLSELEREAARLLSAGQAACDERRQTEASLPAIIHGVDEARQRLKEHQEAQTLRVAALRAQESEWNRARQRLEEVHREQESVRLLRMEAQLRLEGYDAQFTGTYGVNFETAVSEVGDEVRDEDIGPSREKLALKRGRLQDLGPVNVMAIDEHRELKDRLDFLLKQEEDLAQSVASLKAIISRINRETKQLFMETFEQLQTTFGEMFTTFFDGGRAELFLVEDEEGGEPGVDIVAQPPGKRLKNITMLSGGERALTAMSLIFASFLIRPTPFCVLDEIDAPLDEENTVRFTRVLQRLASNSQFIVITHSKQTMEVADSLYGVTMEEPGISALVSVRLSKLLTTV
ncbi:MAG: chromosome segregation protein SMC [Nitrospirae bacterium]|nr:MAG: chromosome segregation protein SMC [Nitrospirota bacterium]